MPRSFLSPAPTLLLPLLLATFSPSAWAAPEAPRAPSLETERGADDRAEAAEYEAEASQRPPASEAAKLRPLLLSTEGSSGMPHRYVGPLGASGLRVTAAPTMLLITAITPESPAALADVPAPTRGRVRLVAIDGLPIESFSKDAMLKRFADGSPEVRLTVGWRESDREPERLLGPYRLPLDADGIAAQRGRYLAAARRSEGASGDTWLAAHEAAGVGDYAKALDWLEELPPSDARRTWQERWLAAQVDQILEGATRLAERGDWSAVAEALTRVVPLNSLQTLRLAEQRARLSAALSQRASYRKRAR